MKLQGHPDGMPPGKEWNYERGEWQEIFGEKILTRKKKEKPTPIEWRELMRRRAEEKKQVAGVEEEAMETKRKHDSIEQTEEGGLKKHRRSLSETDL